MACLEDLAPLLDYKLNCLCLALGEKFCPAHLQIEENKDTPSEGWRCFARLKPLPLYCISLSILLFDFSSSLLLFSLLCKRTWHPDPNKMVILRH